MMTPGFWSSAVMYSEIFSKPAHTPTESASDSPTPIQSSSHSSSLHKDHPHSPSSLFQAPLTIATHSTSNLPSKDCTNKLGSSLFLPPEIFLL